MFSCGVFEMFKNCLRTTASDTCGSNRYVVFVSSFTVSLANSPFITNTIDTATIRSSLLMVLSRKGVLTNFAKFTRKHLRQSLVLNEAADLQSLTLSKKEIPIQMFSCGFCEISRNTIFKEPRKLSISAKNRHCRCSTRF